MMNDTNLNKKKVNTNLIHNIFPFWLKLLYSVFFFTTIYANISYYGVSSFLWLCHFALVLLFFGMWFENKMILSMMALTSIPFYISWSVLFIIDILTDISFESIAYMFEPSLPTLLRGVSLFHIFLPIFILFILFEIGYNPNIFYLQSIIGMVILILTYLDSPELNINWVYGIGSPQNIVHPILYLILLMIALIFIVYLPTHLTLSHFFKKRNTLEKNL
ncbi:MAG: hypothetical protein ACOCRX_02265 [Candidatus Woesearchaeota archaeon]